MIPFLRKITPVLGIFVASILVYACGGDDNGGNGTDVDTTGTIQVTVRADGSTKSNVLVQLFSPGSGSATATVSTNSSGVATFSNVEEGDWEVDVIAPETFALADGEESPKSVSVVAGQTATPSFDLTDVFEGETVEATASLTFSPSALSIDAGTAVRWMNVSVELHTVTPDGHTEWTASSLDDEGDIFVHTFDTPGTYEYFCEPHVGQGMTGTITVN